jgi:hypothetical protein
MNHIPDILKLIVGYLIINTTWINLNSGKITLTKSKKIETTEDALHENPKQENIR